MAKPKEKLAGRSAVIYARYSSHAQNDASIEQQVEACTKFAVGKGLTVLETYSDRAISGKSDKRPDFQRMMKDAHKGKFQCVLAWKSNRMGRNMLEAMVNDAKLQECGVRCLYVEEDFDDSAAGRFSLRTMMNVNQFYSENMAEDIRRGLSDKPNVGGSNGHLQTEGLHDDLPSRDHAPVPHAAPHHPHDGEHDGAKKTKPCSKRQIPMVA